MKAERVGQVWRAGQSLYLVVSVVEVADNRVIYDGLILDSVRDRIGIICRLTEIGDGQWERMPSQERLA